MFDSWNRKIMGKHNFQVHEVEHKIVERKAEVEKLIREMRDANMESLAIPPTEDKQLSAGKLGFLRLEVDFVEVSGHLSRDPRVVDWKQGCILLAPAALK